MRRIYLDCNATTVPDAEVITAVTSSLTESFGNPSSMHWAGQEAQRVLEKARRQTAALINAAPEEIVFTSGATEANNLVLKGVSQRYLKRGGSIVTTAIEHRSVLEPCRFLENHGIRVVRVPAEKNGMVNPDAIAKALMPDTFLVSVMFANNDTGVIQPLREIVGIARARGILIHTDAAQAVGKTAVNVREQDVDFLSLSAHKFYGTRGSGALFVKNGCKLEPLLHGGRQEQRRRAGTENLPAIAGTGKACELAGARLPLYIEQVGRLRDRLENAIAHHFRGALIYGNTAPRLPNTINVGFPGITGMSLMLNLDLHGIAVSVGSACSAGDTEPSHVLLGMGCTVDEARGAVRFSLGAATTETDVDDTLAVLKEIVPQND